MEFLSIFTVGELLAITMVVLQLIVATVLLRDKCLWKIHQNSEHRSAARGQLEGQSNVHRPRRSAGSSMSSRRRLPRFIRSCRDSQALFEEHRKELEAQLAQWRWGRGSGRVLHADLRVMPRLLGARERPQCLGVELARPDMNKVTEEDKRKDMGRCSSDSPTMLERRRSVMLERRRSVARARLLPRVVVIMNPIVMESSSSSSSSSSVESSSSTAAGRFLRQLRARLQRHLEAWQASRVGRRVQRLGTRLRARTWWRRCWAQLRKGCHKNE